MYIPRRGLTNFVPHKSLRKQRQAEREERKASAQAKRAARKALTPAQRKQKRMAALKAKQAPALNPVPTPGQTLLGPSQIQKRKPSDTYKPIKVVQRELDTSKVPRVNLEPFGFSKGGVSTNKKSNFGTTDYRKTGMTTHTSVRSNKK